MSRTLPTGFAAQTEGKVFPAVFLVELAWPGGTVYAWNGYGNLSWDSKTWVGTGYLGAITPIGETSDLRANGCALTLSGIPSDLIAEAFANDAQGQPARIWIGALLPSGALATDPLQVFDGIIDHTAFEDTGDTSTLTVQLEKEAIDRRVVGRRFTHEDQQIDAPGDLIFEYVAGLANAQLTFGPVTSASQGLPNGAAYPTAIGLVKFE